jgi:hypothetical protein
MDWRTRSPLLPRHKSIVTLCQPGTGAWPHAGNVRWQAQGGWHILHKAEKWAYSGLLALRQAVLGRHCTWRKSR